MRDLIKYTEQYKKLNFEEYQVRYRTQEIRRHFLNSNGRRILEIGCGMAPLFCTLNEDEYDLITIVEPSADFHDNAAALAKDNEKVCLINAMFEDFAKTKPHTEWDFILCSSLLHELEDSKGFLLHIRDCCAKDTIVHINVPNANSFHRILGKCSGKIRDIYEMSERNILFQQNQVFDLPKLSELIKVAGFEIVESGSYFVKPFTHDQMYQMLQKGIIDEDVLDGLYKMGSLLPDYGSEIYVNCKGRPWE